MCVNASELEISEIITEVVRQKFLNNNMKLGGNRILDNQDKEVRKNL